MGKDGGRTLVKHGTNIALPPGHLEQAKPGQDHPNFDKSHLYRRPEYIHVGGQFRVIPPGIIKRERRAAKRAAWRAECKRRRTLKKVQRGRQ